jgi:hypothetical protein
LKKNALTENPEVATLQVLKKGKAASPGEVSSGSSLKEKDQILKTSKELLRVLKKEKGRRRWLLRARLLRGLH